jgi:hypothetical protein
MEMNEERTKLIGEKYELFRNKVAWEENLVEGVSMIKHKGYFYAFYAAAGCCGAVVLRRRRSAGKKLAGTMGEGC